MEVNILTFGKIADITASKTIQLQDITSTATLREKLEATYPALRGMSYKIAIDKKVISTETAIHEGAEIALLPPFSGG
jgi:sulfur-carrier protein